MNPALSNAVSNVATHCPHSLSVGRASTEHPSTVGRVRSTGRSVGRADTAVAIVSVELNGDVSVALGVTSVRPDVTYRWNGGHQVKCLKRCCVMRTQRGNIGQ